MSDLIIKGKVVANLGVQRGTSKSGNDWQKATIVVEQPGQYPKRVALDNLKKAEEFAALAVGIEGSFHIEVESREYNGRWYTSVNCWKWETEQPAAQPVAQPEPKPQQAEDAFPF